MKRRQRPPGPVTGTGLSSQRPATGAYVCARACDTALALVLLLGAGLWAPLSAQRAPRTLSLEEAIRLSLERNPVTVAAEGAVSNARADVLQARGSWIPTVNLNSFYSNSSNQRFDQTTGRLVSENYTAQLQSSYVVFDAGQRLMQNRSAGAALNAADANYRASTFQTALLTTQVFYAAAAAADLLHAAEARLARAQQQTTFAQTRLDVGTATASDLLRAQLEEGNAELAVLDARSALETASLQLSQQVGLDEEVQPAPEALPNRAPPLPSIEELVQRATASAPAVVAAQATRRSRHADRLAAYMPFLPTLRLSGGYDWFSFTFPPNQQSWSLRLTASLPVLNGFQREAALQRAAAAERTAEARARDAVIGARVAAESAAREIMAADQRVVIADRAAKLAEEDLRVQEERYQLGASTILDLEASQIALADAEAAAIRARQGLGTAIAQLEAVLGQRLDRE